MRAGNSALASKQNKKQNMNISLIIEKEYRGIACKFEAMTGFGLIQALSDEPELADKFANLINSQVGAHNLGSIQDARDKALKEWEALPAEKQKAATRPEGPLTSFSVLAYIRKNKVKAMKAGEPTAADKKAYEAANWPAMVKKAMEELGKSIQDCARVILSQLQKGEPALEFDCSSIEEVSDLPMLYRAKRLFKKPEPRAKADISLFQ